MSDNVIKKFSKTQLQELVWEKEVDDLKVVSDEIMDHTRWSVTHKMIFQDGDKFYQAIYSVGATETQDERPFEFDPDQIECNEVVPVQKTITVYEKVKTEGN